MEMVVRRECPLYWRDSAAGTETGLNPFILIPVGLYLVFSGLFIQQGITNVSLARTGMLRSGRNLVYFAFVSALFCLSLLLVILSPELGLDADSKRVAFFFCWLVAPMVGYLYVSALAEHLEITRRRVRWLLWGYLLDSGTTLICGAATWVTGKGVLFSHETGPVQSLIDVHIGGVFSPNMLSLGKLTFTSALVISSTVFFLREITKKERIDISLAVGVSLTGVAIMTEAAGYLLQWPMAFSLLPLANAVEMVRLTYLQTIDTGRNIEQTQRRLRHEQVQMKSHLEALSHDVRTPLASLKLGLDALRDEGAYERLAHEVEYLHVVFSNLVSLFELELSSSTLVYRQNDVRKSLDAISQRFAVLAQEKGVEIHISDEGEALLTHSDPAALEQALSNLVYNAIIHAEGRVAVAAFREGDGVRIQILDDGPKVSEIDIPRLTDRHFRHRLEALMACPGWGLALAISNALVQLQGGTLSVESTEDDFTAVNVRLRARADARTGDEESECATGLLEGAPKLREV